MQHLSRRDFVHAGCSIVAGTIALSAMDRAKAGLIHRGGGAIAPTGRVVLNMNAPNYFDNLYPYLNILHSSDAVLFNTGGGTALFRTNAPPGGSLFGSPSAYGICCDNNGQFINMTGATGVAQITQIFFNNSGLISPQLAGVSYTLMWTGGIGWRGEIRGAVLGGIASLVATGATSSLVFTMPASVETLMFVQWDLNAGSLASPPQNIALVPTASVAAYNAGAIFAPGWFSQTNQYGGILRCMPIMNTPSNNFTTSIDSIPTTTCSNWNGQTGITNGAPLSVLSALALQSNKHIWLNIPQGFMSAKLRSFSNSSAGGSFYDATQGGITNSNPAIINFASNQPWVNGDNLVIVQPNVNFAGSFAASVICIDLASSIFTKTGHNFVKGQPVTPGLLYNGGADSSTYPTGFSRGTTYFVTNVTANTFQIASTLANANAGTALTLTGTMKGPVQVFGAITGGSGYTNGTYTAVPMTGGTGTLCTATVVVSGGAVTAVIPDNTSFSNAQPNSGSGNGYTKGDSLSALAANIGGTGSGFSVVVSSVVIRVTQVISAASFGVASSTTQTCTLSGPGSDTSLYGIQLGNISIASSVITSSRGSGWWQNGEQVQFGVYDGVLQDQATYPPEITKGTSYFIVNSSGGTFQISNTLQGSPITLTGSGVGQLNAYKGTHVTSCIVQSVFDATYTYTQVRRFANFFNTALAGTKIIAYYEYSNEIWNPGGGQNTAALLAAQGPVFFDIGASNGAEDKMAGYVQAVVANAIFDEYSGDQTRYKMMLGDFQSTDVGGGGHFNACLAGIALWQTASGSPRTIQNLFNHVIVTNYWSQSYNPNGSTVACTFNTGTSTVNISGPPSLGSPFKFHATSGALPSPLAENTTYWLVGSSPNFGIATTPLGSPVTLSGTLGTYTCYHCGSDVIGELIQQSIALNISLPGTWPTKYSYYEAQLRQDVNDMRWTGGQGTNFVNGPGYASFNWAATQVYPVITANFLAVGKPCAGLTLMPYEGGDDNSPIGSFWALFGQGTAPNNGVSITASITGTTLQVTGGSSQFVAIGGDLPSAVVITASASGTTTMTVTASNGILAPGQTVTGPGVTGSPTIISQLSGSTGGTGTYQLSSVQTFSNAALTVPTGVSAGTIVTGIRTDLGAGFFTVNNSQTVASSTLTLQNTTFQDFFLTNMYSDTYAQAFVDFYNLVGPTYFGGHMSQFLDVNSFGVQNSQGTYGMARYIGDNNPRVTWVSYVNNLP